MQVIGRTLSVILVAAAMPLPPLAAAQEICDPELRVSADDPNGYRLRGDRCEGLFIESVSGSLNLASLHFAPRGFPVAFGETVGITSTPAADSAVRLRIVSLKRGVHYRMDTVRSPDAVAYSWSTDLVDSLALSDEDLGLLSWVVMDVGGRPRTVYSPVLVDGGSGRVEVVIVPDVALDEVYVSLLATDDRGTEGGYLEFERPVDLGWYPAHQPVSFPLSAEGNGRGLDAGLYRLEIGAVIEGGGAGTLEVYLHLADR